ncbi:MAG TPA: serine hydrolase [Chryseolinea sp.]
MPLTRKVDLYALFLLIPGSVLSQIDHAALNTLVNRARETHSSALVVYHDDKLILDECFDKTCEPIDAMSATKSIVSLGIGLLITEGILSSIDERVFNFYPEWNQGLKKEITIRHLLNHTSGIQSLRYASEIYQSPDYVQLALAADIDTEPGTTFFYNNKAVNLLAGIIEKASGMRMDHYISEKIFKPLEIENFIWLTDAFVYSFRSGYDSAYLKKGNPIGMAGLLIHASDMAKIGLLVFHRGNWQGKQIIAESWIDECMKPGQNFNATYGLLWWLIYDPTTSYITFDGQDIQKLRDLRLNDTLIHDLESVSGRYRDSEAFWKTVEALTSVKAMGGRTALREALFKRSFFEDIYTFVTQHSRIVGVAARGSLGQLMNVFPDKKLVVVRTIRQGNSKSPADNFTDFDRLSYEVVK